MTDLTPRVRLRVKCSLGYANVIPYLEVLDEDPGILLSGLPFFLEEEWDALPRMNEPERQRVWERRATAVAEENNDRALDPKRRIGG